MGVGGEHPDSTAPVGEEAATEAQVLTPSQRQYMLAKFAAYRENDRIKELRMYIDLPIPSPAENLRRYLSHSTSMDLLYGQAWLSRRRSPDEPTMLELVRRAFDMLARKRGMIP